MDNFKKMQQFSVLIFTFLCSLGLTSCISYKWGNEGRQIPGGYKSVAVPIFQNSTHEVGAEVMFTNSMIEEISRSHLAEVEIKDRAAVVLEGVISDINYVGGGPLTGYDANNPNYSPLFPLPADTLLNSEYRVYVTVHISLRRSSDQKVVWSSKFTGERSYLAAKIGTEYLNSANTLYNHSTRQQTLQLIATDLMAQAYDQMTENF